LQLNPAKKFDFKSLAVRLLELNGGLCEGLFFYSFFRQPPAEAGAAGFAEDGQRRQAVEIPEGVQFEGGGDVQDRPGGKEDGGADEELPRAGEVVFEKQAHWRFEVSANRKKLSLTVVISLDKKAGWDNFKRKEARCDESTSRLPSISKLGRGLYSFLGLFFFQPTSMQREGVMKSLLTLALLLFVAAGAFGQAHPGDSIIFESKTVEPGFYPGSNSDTAAYL
jgi:hypothetical protein